MKQLISLFLIVAILFSLCACENLNPTKPATTDIVPSAEVSAATAPPGLKEYEISEWDAVLQLGIIPEGMSYDGYITPDELIDLLSNNIELAGGDVSVLTDTLKSGYKSAETVTRKDNALALTTAAKAMGIDTRMVNKAGGDTFLDDTSNADKDFWDSTIFNIPGDLATLITDEYEEQEWPYVLWPIWFCSFQGSLVSHQPLMSTDEACLFHFTDSTTRKDAILGAWRLYTSLPQKPDYVTLQEAYDYKNTIPAELLNKDSSLPEISNSNIPFYNGTVLQGKADTYNTMSGYYDEDMIRALSEAGVNFVSVWYSFAMMGYPDYDPGEINLNELKELDQLIGWCIKYDIHASIECVKLPNAGGYPREVVRCSGDEEWQPPFFHDTKLREMTKDYWALLAKRYANVPAKFLSFNLLVEATAETEEIFVGAFTPIVEAIREYNADRVIFCYGNYGGPGGNYEGMAALGCPIAWSFYNPSLFTTCKVNDETFPGCKLTWPMIYLPNYMTEDNGFNSLPIVLQKDIQSITVYAKSNIDTKMQISAGEKVVLSEALPTNDEWQPYTVDVERGTKQIELKLLSGCLQFSSITLTDAEGSKITISPNDVGYNKDSVMPTLTVSADGMVTSSKELDFEYFYNMEMKDQKEIADKYNVGFMVVEWGNFNGLYLEDPDSVLAYTEFMKNGLDSYGIPSAYHQSVYCFGTSTILVPKAALPEDFTTNPGRYQALSYSSKYYIDTWMKDILGR